MLRFTAFTKNRRLQIFFILVLASAIPTTLAFMSSGFTAAISLNIGTEMIGAVVTFVLIDWIIRRSDKADEERNSYKIQLGSSEAGVAANAAREIFMRDWHNDGTLHYAHLTQASLIGLHLDGFDFTGADMRGVKLNSTRMEKVILKEVHLGGADAPYSVLKEANLRNANLEDADFSHSNFTHADLRDVNLKNADLSHANLRGADLRGADLRDANLWGADLTDIKTDENTTIFDGKSFQDEKHIRLKLAIQRITRLDDFPFIVSLFMIAIIINRTEHYRRKQNAT